MCIYLRTDTDACEDGGSEPSYGAADEDKGITID